MHKSVGTDRAKRLRSQLLAAAFAVLAVFAMPLSARAAESDFSVGRSGSYGSFSYTFTYSGNETEVVFPSDARYNSTSVTSIDGFACQGLDKKSIRSITIPEGYTSIGPSVFEGMESLAAVNLPSSLKTISSNAFKGCTALESVSFAEGGASLGIMMNAFQNCTSLEEITLPAHFSAVGNNRNPFRGCAKLKKIAVTDGNSRFVAADNALYLLGDEGAMLLSYPAGSDAEGFVIPAEVGGKAVTSLGAFTFSDAKKLKALEIPASVTSTAGFTIYDSSVLETVVIKASSVEFGTSTFDALASSCGIYTANESVQAAVRENNAKLTSVSSTLENAPEIGDSGAAQPSVAATVSLSDARLSDSGDSVVFDLYLENASHVNTLLVRFGCDSAAAGEISVSPVSGIFDASSVKDGGVVMLSHTGNNDGVSFTERTKVATISLSLKAGAKGAITLSIEKAAVSGIVTTDASAVGGSAETDAARSSASLTISTTDVNSDGKTDQLDITEAQRYYQMRKGDAGWGKAQGADVNNDGAVDIQDLIAIFKTIEF